MFPGHRHMLIGVGLTMAGLAVADAALPESKELGDLAGGPLVVAVAGYVTAGIGAFQAFILGRIWMFPLILVCAPFALWTHLFSIPLAMREGAVRHGDSGHEIVAWRLAHDRLVVVRLFELFGPETVEGVSIFHPAWQRRELCQMLESAGVPQVSDTLQELCEITGRWTSGIRWNVEPDGDTGEVVLKLIVDDRNLLALNEVHGSMSQRWNDQDLCRDDLLRLAVWQTLATDVFNGYKDEGVLDRALAWAAW